MTKKLSSLGCREVPRTGNGSHRKCLNPTNGGPTVVPDWGSDDLKLGTIRAAVREIAAATRRRRPGLASIAGRANPPGQ